MPTVRQCIAGAAVIGLAAAGGAAVTGTGVVNAAGDAQFVGGTVSQSVSGVTLTDIHYFTLDDTNTAVDSVLLTFDPAGAGRPVAVALRNTAVTFTCQDIQVDGTSLCYPDAGQPDPVGVTGIDITVS